MDEINDWLHLDQADEDIGLFNAANEHYPQEQFEFQRESPFVLDHSDQHGHGQQHHPHSQNSHHHPHNSPILSLDPSTIISYPASQSAPTDTDTDTTPNTAAPSSQFNTTTVFDHFPTYALDPALLLPASISTTTANNNNNNNNNNNSNSNTTTTSRSCSSSGNSSSSNPNIPFHTLVQAEKPFSKSLDLKITLPRRSPSTHPSFKKEDTEGQDHPGGLASKSAHSRSSSAFTFTQQPSLNSPPLSSHKRTLSHSHALVNVPEWEDKPSAEEYKMLSSKEKRQLRNKISARNFRHRRKQHISALEQQVAQRDQTIETLYNDLDTARSENKELKSQVELLKQKWSDLMKKIEEMSLGTISPTTSVAPASTTTNTPGAQSTSANALLPTSPRSRSAKSNNAMITLPNLHKDLGSHTRKPFNGVGGMTGGNVGVHTTLIPDVSVDVYKGPIGSYLDGPLTSGVGYAEEEQDEFLSPQALMEQKLERGLKGVMEPSEEEMDGMAIPFKVFLSGRQVSADDEVIRKVHGGYGSGGLTRGEVTVVDGSGEGEQVRAQLWRLLYEALRINDGAPDSPIDPAKLAACLDGRLVLKLVEPAPPPYPCFNSSLDQLATRVADCHI
ncbi:hypothetical protein PCANC_22407 [Puccinia coronata f. sp. avenae]|uniref:BZIP domain-containing protein n=1 Tax=Puccinia coronata f. sp. avenae TaxID=200324 RepID=A0A2N5TUL7_9BASI|nr:hypothetical protein PCANC_22407 [Puccinia coronata f. sp. avenae]